MLQHVAIRTTHEARQKREPACRIKELLRLQRHRHCTHCQLQAKVDQGNHRPRQHGEGSVTASSDGNAATRGAGVHQSQNS